MNSFQDLNNYSNTPVRYGDERDPVLELDTTTPADQIYSVQEGDTITVDPTMNIVEALSLYSDTEYIIDVSAVPGATVAWPEETFGCIVTQPSDGIYMLSGVNSASIWQVVKNPVITLPRDYSGIFTANASLVFYIEDSTPTSYDWDNIITVNDLPELSEPSNDTYDEDTVLTLTGCPKILDLENAEGDIYTLTVVPNPTTAVSDITVTDSEYSAAWTWDAPTKTLTITGTRNTINAITDVIDLTPTVNYDDNFQLIWTLTNPDSELETVKSQTMLIGVTNEEIANLDLARFYHSNTASLLFDANKPAITEAGTYTLVLEFDTDIGILGTTATDANWNAGTLTYTITGTQAEINTFFDTVRLWPNRDGQASATVDYTLTTNGTTVAISQFTITGLEALDVITGGTGTQTVLEDQQDIAIDTVALRTYWNDTVTVEIYLTTTAGTASPSAGTLSGTGWSMVSNKLTKTITAPNTPESLDAALDGIELDLATDYDTTTRVVQDVRIGGSVTGSRYREFTITPKLDSLATFDINYNNYVADAYTQYINSVNTGWLGNLPERAGSVVLVDVETDLVLAGDAPIVHPYSQGYAGTEYLPEGSGIRYNYIDDIQSGQPWLATSSAFGLSSGSVYDLAVRYQPSLGKMYLAAGDRMRIRGSIGHLAYSSDGLNWYSKTLPNTYTPSSGWMGPSITCIAPIWNANGTGGVGGEASTFVGGTHGYISRCLGFEWDGTWTNVNGTYVSSGDDRRILTGDEGSSTQPLVAGLAGYVSSSIPVVLAVVNHYKPQQNPSNPISYPIVQVGSYVCRYINIGGGVYRFRPIRSTGENYNFQRLRLAMPNTNYPSGIFMAIVRENNPASKWTEPPRTALSWQIWRSTNNGSGWTTVYSGPEQILDLQWNGKSWIATTTNGMLFSTDAFGDNWVYRIVTSDQNRGIACVTNNRLNYANGKDEIITVGGSGGTAYSRFSTATEYDWTVPAHGARPEKTVSVTVPFGSNGEDAVTEIYNDLVAANDQGWTVSRNYSTHTVTLDMNSNSHTTYTQTLTNVGNSLNADVGAVHTFSNTTTPH